MAKFAIKFLRIKKIQFNWLELVSVKIRKQKWISQNHQMFYDSSAFTCRLLCSTGRRTASGCFWSKVRLINNVLCTTWSWNRDKNEQPVCSYLIIILINVQDCKTVSISGFDFCWCKCPDLQKKSHYSAEFPCKYNA